MKTQRTSGTDMLGSLLDSRRDIEDCGRETSEGFKHWARECRKYIKRSCKVLKFSIGHYYWDVFVEGKNAQVWYISISDVRYFPDSPIIYRTAKNSKNYSGLSFGANRQVSAGQLTQVLQGL